jgi:hypothetical protein
MKALINRIKNKIIDLREKYLLQARLKKMAKYDRASLKPTAVFFFHNRTIIKQSFAYYYPLIVGLIKNNYRVVVDFKKGDYEQLSNMNHQLFETDNLFLMDVNTLKNVDLAFSDDVNKLQIQANKTFDYQAYRLYNRLQASKRYLTQPFFIHTYLVNSTIPVAKRERQIKVFFSGNTSEKAYSSFKGWDLMNRVDIINTVKETFPKIQMNLLFPLTNIQKYEIVIQDWRWSFEQGGALDYRIPYEKWFDALNECDFFIAPPGVVIPFSHNLVEAMAVGSIPITNYGHLFNPPLIDGVHCLVFNDRESLIAKIKHALCMDDDAKTQIRANILAYYRQHLCPSAFAKKVIADNGCDGIEYYSTYFTLK